MFDIARPDKVEAQVMARPSVPGRIERAMHGGVATHYARGVVQAARIRAVAVVAAESLHALEQLEDDETAAVARDPMNAGRRQRAVVDAAGSAFRQAVEETGRWT